MAPLIRNAWDGDVDSNDIDVEFTWYHISK